MKERIFSAVPLTALALLAFFCHNWLGHASFALLAVGMVLTGIHECFGLLQLADRCRYQTVTSLAGLGYLAGVAYGCISGETAGTSHVIYQIWTPGVLLGFFFLLCWQLFQKGPTREQIQSFFGSIGIFFYIGWMLSFFVRIYFENSMYLLLILAMTKFGDIGAFALGTLTAKMPGGNHKLAPTLSPKKSWEGLLGGCLASVLVGCGLRAAFPAVYQPFAYWELIVLGVLAGSVGLVGDLMESAMKRAAGQKDSGRIPGLGGALDILDSLIPMGGIFYLWLLLTP